MSASELRDELMTLLVAGHETTASSLAWTFARLARDPRVLAELRREVDSEDGGPYLTATINEVLRSRPVLQNNAPRYVAKPITVGGWDYEPGISLVPNAYLIHHDPEIYPDPYTFRPERFLDEKPGTYTWIPFGGGRRRCLGSSFAILEMKVVIAEVVRRFEITATPASPRWRAGGTSRLRLTWAPRWRSARGSASRYRHERRGDDPRLARGLRARPVPGTVPGT